MDGQEHFKRWRDQAKDKDGYVTEQQRLESQHEVWVDAMGKAIYAPVDLAKGSLTVLDSACANGRWLRDLSSLYPLNTYYGTDINSSLYPTSPLENMHFRDWNIMTSIPDGWEGKFDLIHQRLVLGGTGKKLSSVIASFRDMLKSGGWLQLVELDTADDPSNHGAATRDLLQMLRDITSTIMGTDNCSALLKDEMVRAGLVDVSEDIMPVMYGARNESATLQQRGIEAMCSAVAPISAVLKGMPHTLSDEKMESLESRLRKELTEEGSCTSIRVIYGRRP